MRAYESLALHIAVQITRIITSRKRKYVGCMATMHVCMHLHLSASTNEYAGVYVRLLALRSNMIERKVMPTTI